MSALISLQNVSKTFGTGRLAFTALHPTNLDVNRGEVLLMVGPSGSGKTTLLSLMGCVLNPSTGSIFFENRRIDGLTEDALAVLRRDTLGFVFQQFNLLTSLPAIENVELPLVLRGVSRRERRERAERALVQVGLADKIHSKPNQLSGGQQQRVAIARALASDPKVLLCDEPTAALDAESGREVLTILSTLAHEQQHAVVIVTHDNRIYRYADRIIHLEDGRIVEKAADTGAH
jgi:putative ABC transport system ATP-binding protein